MSTLIVDVCTVEEIAAHPNADRIERVRVKNWWCVASKGHYKVGDKAVYVPPDAVISEKLAERWGIAKYCSPLAKDITGDRPPGLRVRASRFRGVSSFGTIQDPDDQSWPVGMDVREHYGITKYEPPLKANDGDAAAPIPAFHAYTSIENLGNFPGVLQDGEEVVITEKLHGTNCRIGVVADTTEPCDFKDSNHSWEWVAGSHSVRRKEFNEKGQRSMYWLPLAQDKERLTCPLHHMVLDIMHEKGAGSAIIVFGEIFGAGVQDMQYGQKGKSFRIFDISVDGNYLNWSEVEHFVNRYAESGLSLVPILYKGPFSMEKVNELVDGPTTICTAEDIKEPFKGREGIVIKPTTERFDGVLGGRAILKYISVDYHERKNKNATEDH